MRFRVRGVRSHVCGFERKGSFVRLDVTETELQTRGLPADLRIFLDSPSRIFVRAAEKMSRLVREGEISHHVALLRLLSLGSELCGTYSRDPLNHSRGKLTYEIMPATTVGDIVRFLSLCKGVRGIRLAREAASFLVDGLGSPLESELYYAIVLPARLGGIGFPKPDVNRCLFSKDRGGSNVLVQTEERLLGGSLDSRSISMIHHQRLTPDLSWDFGDLQLTIEVDSYEFHGGKSAFVDDRLRDQDYARLGLRNLRVTYANVRSVDALENFLDIIIGIAAPFLSAGRVGRMRRSLRLSEIRALRSELVSVFGARPPEETR